MKIAFIVESFPETSETFILRRAADLIERGHDLDVFARLLKAWDVHPDLVSRLEGLEVKKLANPFRWRLKDSTRGLAHSGLRLGRVAAAAVRARGSARSAVTWNSTLPFLSKRYDLIHANYGHLGLEYLEVSAMLDVPMVVNLRGTDVMVTMSESPDKYRPLFEKAVKFIAVSHPLRDRVIELGCDPDKVAVIPTEVDVDYFKPDPAKKRGKGKLSIVTVGRLTWQKGYLYALHAAAKLAESGADFEYRIVGGGAGRSEIEAAIKDLNLHDRVTLLGKKDSDEVREELARADVFLLASVSEGIAGCTLEAQAMGLPVVATTAGGIPEAVADAESGLLVKPRDADALAAALRKLCDAPDLRSRLGERGRKRMVQEFSGQVLLPRLESVYREVIDKWRAR